MANILNLLINFAIIFFGNMIAPEYIVINSWKDAALAALIIFMAQLIGNVLINLILIPSLVAIEVSSSSLSVVMGIISIILVIVLSIGIDIASVILADKILDGFTITTTLAYIIVIILTSVLSVSNNSAKVKASD